VRHLPESILGVDLLYDLDSGCDVRLAGADVRGGGNGVFVGVCGEQELAVEEFLIRASS
jgi:hypothetical protein